MPGVLEIGGTLREARSRAGLELGEVEAATMIPVRFLEALEAEQFETLPAGLYRRSFLREYADFLGLPGETYAHEYELRTTATEPDQSLEPVSRGAALSVVRLIGIYSPGRAIAVCVAALVAIAVWQLGGGPSPTGAARQTPPSVHGRASPAHSRTASTATVAQTRPAASPSPSPSPSPRRRRRRR